MIKLNNEVIIRVLYNSILIKKINVNQWQEPKKYDGRCIDDSHVLWWDRKSQLSIKTLVLITYST